MATMKAVAGRDKVTKNTDRFTVPQDSMSEVGFSGSIYVTKGSIADGKKLEITIKAID